LLPFDRYERAGVESGVVHLGLGAFHRAHQAPVFDDLIAGGDGRWGVTGVAMRSPDVVQTLADQDGLFSLTIRGATPTAPRVIGAIRGLMIAAREPEAVIAAIAAPATQLVTLTITEKGYLDHGPAGAMAIVAAGLARRQAAGLGPVTVMSCDNRAGNGPFARAAVLAAGESVGVPEPALRWIDEAVAFPSTMVDRITPATTAAMIDANSAALGARDEAAVWTEPFWQWVVEDRFAAARPDLAAAGVTMVDDVASWEDAKLRLLNAAHSALAYRGLLNGFVHVHEAIGDAMLRLRVEALWDEAATTLDTGTVDVPSYRAALLRRFVNPALPHALIQIAADGSQKLPPRILATMAERRARGLASPALAWAVAGWIRALRSENGLKDPLLPQVQGLARAGAPVTALLAAISVEGDPAMAAEVEAALAAG
jgi:fructuronate reductase